MGWQALQLGASLRQGLAQSNQTTTKPASPQLPHLLHLRAQVPCVQTMTRRTTTTNQEGRIMWNATPLTTGISYTQATAPQRPQRSRNGLPSRGLQSCAWMLAIRIRSASRSSMTSASISAHYLVTLFQGRYPRVLSAGLVRRRSMVRLIMEVEVAQEPAVVERAS